MPDNPKPTVISISTSTIVRVILFGFLIVALFILRDVVLVILTSIVIASFIERASRRIARYGINRTLSVFLMYFSSFAVVATILYLFAPIFIIELSKFSDLISQYIPGFSIFSGASGGALSSAQHLVATLSQNYSLTDFTVNAKSLVSGVSSGFLATLSFIFGGVLNFILIVVISFYLSIEERGIEKFLRIITPLKNEEYIINLWDRSQRKIALWIQGQMLLGILVGVLIYLGLSLLGVEYALLLSVTAALFELIPFGLVLAVIPALSFSYSEGGLSLMLIVSGFYLIVQQFENYLIAPLIVKKIIGISPLVVILSVLIGAKLAGFWGLILAIPVAVSILEFINDIEKNKNALASKTS